MTENTQKLDGPRLAPASGKAATSLVVFVHGYGADGNDLIGLGQHWAPALPDTAFVSPHAPFRCDMSPMGYQWFPISMSRERGEYQAGVEAAAPLLNTFIDEELSRLNLSAHNLALVGFSQGTMMSLYVAPRRAQKIAGIVGYSGVLIGAEELNAPDMHKPPVLLVHGDRDDILPIDYLHQARNGLADAGFELEWHVSQGLGHGIDQDGLRLGGEFLHQVLT